MIKFSVGNLICVAFNFFLRTIASVDVVGCSEQGRAVFRHRLWLIKVIKSLYDDPTSAVLLSGNAGDFFRTTVGARQ